MACAYVLAALALGLSSAGPTRRRRIERTRGRRRRDRHRAVGMLMLPLAEESSTRVTTDLTLLELADPARPLLRRLALEAPGTWAHSIAMANLCESACNAIGANGLLARVGCYYHDVGKLIKPAASSSRTRRGASTRTTSCRPRSRRPSFASTWSRGCAWRTRPAAPVRARLHSRAPRHQSNPLVPGAGPQPGAGNADRRGALPLSGPPPAARPKRPS